MADVSDADFMGDIIKMKLTGGLLDFLRYKEFDTSPPAPLDFCKISPGDTMTVSVAADDATKAPWSFTHLTPALLNNIGKPLPGNETYLCVLPPSPSPGETPQARARHKQNYYLGVAVLKTPKVPLKDKKKEPPLTFIAYRINADGTATDVIKSGKALFESHLKNEEWVKTVIDKRNQSASFFTLDFKNDNVIDVTMALPFLPTDVFKVITKKPKEKAAEPTTQPAAVPAPEATVIDDDDDDVEPGSPADPALPVASVAPAAASPSSAVLTKAAQAAETLSPLQNKEVERVFAGKKRKADDDLVPAIKAPNGARKANDELVPAIKAPNGARHEKIPVHRIAMSVPSKGVQVSATDPITFERLQAHLRFKLEENPNALGLPVFAGKQTMGAVMDDLNTMAVISHWARVTKELAPWLVGMAPPPECPDTMSADAYKFFL